MPVSGPSVSCITPKRIQSLAPEVACSALAKAANSNTAGNAMPSLRPLSTLIAWRIRTGTACAETTACPRAASVGASNAASNAASQNKNDGKAWIASNVPPAIARGRPMSNMRTGKLWSRRRRVKSMRAASVNNTSTSVNSAIMCMAE